MPQSHHVISSVSGCLYVRWSKCRSTGQNISGWNFLVRGMNSSRSMSSVVLSGRAEEFGTIDGHGISILA